MQYLLVSGADPSRIGRDGWHPLHLAASRGHQAIVQLLLAAGARPDRPSSHGGFGGATALHVAVAAGDRSVVDTLLRGGADPDARDDAGFTPLHIAASTGASAIVKALVLRGADARALVAETSALELALRNGHRATAALLRQILRSRRC